MKSWIYAVMVVAAGAVMGCSSGSSGSGNGGDGGNGGGDGGNGGTGGTTTTTTTTTGMTTTTTTMTVDACADMSDCSACDTGELCSKCCDDANPDANVKLITYLVNNCACADMAPCQMDCAPAMMGDPDICMNPTGQTTQACVDCINGQIGMMGAACVSATVQACAGDQACVPILQCYQGCPQ